MRRLPASKNSSSESLPFDSRSVSTIDLKEGTVPPPTFNDGTRKLELEASRVVHLLVPVAFNMLVTLICWLFIYDAQHAETSLPYLLDSRTSFTTGIDVLDGLLNGLTSTVLITTISFVLLALALCDYRTLVKAWLGISHLLVLFVIFGVVLRDMFKAIDYKIDWMSLLIVVWNYGIVGVVVIFKNAPQILYQLYVVCNCSLISLFYLRHSPVHTIWFMLLGFASWDAFAVLTPVGPLRLISEKAHEYSDLVHALLMFTTEPISTQSSVDQFRQVHQATNPSSTASSLRDDGRPNEEFIVDYEDDENETEVIQLGLGDFVLYGVLVGKAASSGSWPATFIATIGVLVGLCITLTTLPWYGTALPALPVSITFGLVLHLAAVLFVDPFLDAVVSRQFVW